ncbi:MAG: DUF4935 domain-containing protein [Cyanobacteria bacterium SZAS LIN-3]|nr:DUF4935 domain-containing protein [Cyanobacteria bacterium SZAS LIN-3]
MPDELLLSVDTNILLNTKESSPYWPLLRAFIGKSSCTVGISQVVLDEYASKLLDQVRKKCSDAQTSLGLFRGLQNSGLHIVSKKGHDISQTLEALENLEVPIPSRDKYLNDFVLPKISGLFGTAVEPIDYPAIAHKEVVDRLLDTLPPFKNKEKDKGYRDYLIWRGLVEKNAIAKHAKIYFVSENTTDFADEEKKAFHKALLEECSSPEKLILYVSLAKFVEEIAEPHLNKLSNQLQTLQNRSSLSFLSAQFKPAAGAFEEVGRELAGYNYRALAGLEKLFSFASSVRRVVLVKVDDVVEMAESAILLDCTVSVEYDMHVKDPFTTNPPSTVEIAFALRINCKIAVVETETGKYLVQSGVEITRSLFDRVIKAQVSIVDDGTTVNVVFTGQVCEVDSITSVNKDFSFDTQELPLFIEDFEITENIKAGEQLTINLITTDSILSKWSVPEK